MWKNSLKCWPCRLQDYNIWSEEMSFFASCQTRLVDFEFMWLKRISLFKVHVFDIFVVYWVRSSLKIKKTSKKTCFYFLRRFLSKKRYAMKGNKIANNTNIRLNNVNSNGQNVVANNLNHTNFFFWKMSKLC